ncbi:MAG: hypothetical protein KR126chlam6_00220 [Candidatus Anoxychlamydiales bacterium]|nr:hypothetical protein [Candidatus Anoxychlamydiales bacterium]
MNFNISIVSSTISTVSPYLPALCHLDPASTTITEEEKLFNYAMLALNTLALTSSLFFAFSNRKNLKEVAISLGLPAVAVICFVAQYMELNSIPFESTGRNATNFTNSTS